MEVQKIKVSAVSYLNTLPFLYGINNSDIINDIELSLDIPSDCAKKLMSGEVDLGLVPVAILPELKEYHIVSDYCIGAEGKVKSVALFSEVGLNEIETIYLDYQSKTSVNLAQVLAKEYWKISPKWIEASTGFENEIKGNVAGIIIGDRTFHYSKKFKFDLAQEWLDFSGLPFVFACWISNKKLPNLFVQKFNQGLKLGVNSINDVILNYNENFISNKCLKRYLTENISYLFDEDKQRAIQKFLNYIKVNKAMTSKS